MSTAPKPTRLASNPLPGLDDMDVDVEATVKRPRINKTRIVSEAVVDALRSGRALQRSNSASDIKPDLYTDLLIY